MVAFARSSGVASFWAASPDSSLGDVTTHWRADGGDPLVVRQGEQRCILVSAGTGSLSPMFARFRPCTAKLASGIVTVAAAAAPPPPPGVHVRHWYDPLRAPPPPPSLKSAALQIFTRNEVRPRTKIVCSGGFEGAEHKAVCLELAQMLARWQPIAGAGVIAPFCSRVCWRSCEGQGHTGGLDDGFLECPDESCATESCIDFLKAECPPAIHAQLDSLYNGACTLVPPSPPMPPLPPPLPPYPPAPQSPPPKIAYTLRERDTEQEWDGECELVSYAKCREIVRQYAGVHGTADVLAVSFSPCQGLPDEVSCFQGCSYGGPNGGSYRFLLPEFQETYGAFNPKRCKLAEYPLCACNNAAPAPPGTFAPPPPLAFTEDYHMTPPHYPGQPTLGGAELPAGSARGSVSAMVKRLVNARTIDLALRSSHHSVGCPGRDDGETTCARYCAAEWLGGLRAFTVTATHTASPPPPPPPPSPPPHPPPPPSTPFNACANSCEGLPEGETRCRDGGYGSFFPTLCAYSTQCAQCGFRENTRAFVNDDSCAHANNGVCEDGDFGSSFFTNADGEVTHLCGLGTDFQDCGAERQTQFIGADAFTNVTRFFSPTPPPPSPLSPPPPPPPLPLVGACAASSAAACHAWFVKETDYTYTHECTSTDAICTPSSGAKDLCSDGGFGSHAIVATAPVEEATFACPYGTQCWYNADGEIESPCASEQRPRDAIVDINCADDASLLPDGSCRDSCWVDTNGGVHMEEERFTASTEVPDKQCHDGGLRAISNKCPYGTQSTRCGPGRPVVYAMIQENATRRRLQNYVQEDELEPPPSPPPFPVGVTVPTLAADSALTSPPPSPPTPPPPPPPSPSPTPPEPSPPPDYFGECTCSCFTEDADHLNGASGWSDIEVRARATSVVATAVLYKAHAVLTRGDARDASPHVWVEGDSAAAAGGRIERYVKSPASAMRVAHLVAGWTMGAEAGGWLLGAYALRATMGGAPHWWNAALYGPFEASSSALPNVTQDVDFWRDVCATQCGRAHDDEVEYALVDLRNGLYYGDDVAHPSRCECYAAGTAHGVASHVAPSDANVLTFLGAGGATLVNNYVGAGGARNDAGLRYRQYVNLYAVHRKAWEGYFVVPLQSTVYYARVFEAGYVPKDANVDFEIYKTSAGVAHRDACLTECAGDAQAPLGRTMLFDPATQACQCGSRRALDLAFDELFHYDPASTVEIYAIQFCRGVVSASDHTLVYHKSDATTCPGSPVGSGMILSNGTVLFSRDPGDSGVPFDLECRAACDANEECAMATSYVETFEVHDAGRLIPPPPSPPAPPAPPPPRVPPLPPFPPTIPPLEKLGPRVWSPGFAEAPEGDATEILFRLKCGVEGHLISFFSSASQLLVLDQARELMAQGTYASSLCPYECTRAVTHFAVGETNRENLRSGVGLNGEGFAYPGYADDAVNGFARYARHSGAASSKLLHATHMARNVSLATCTQIFERHRLLAPHGVWMLHDENIGAPTDGERVGDCGLFLGARSRVDAELWRAFYEYARLVLNLGHFESYVDDDIAAAHVHTSAVEPCTVESTVCTFWSEFQLDEEEYS